MCGFVCSVCVSAASLFHYSTTSTVYGIYSLNTCRVLLIYCLDLAFPRLLSSTSVSQSDMNLSSAETQFINLFCCSCAVLTPVIVVFVCLHAADIRTKSNQA